MSSYSTITVGNAGEKIAKSYLRRRFYKILDLQYRSYFGEIDIIAVKRNIIAFIEVRTRSDNYKISPAESVGKAKQIRIIKTAYCYIKENHIKLQPRFDIIEVIINPVNLKKISINHIENAFTQGGTYAVF